MKFDAHFALAVAALAALLLVTTMFSFYPPKLSGTSASDTLTTLKDLTVMAFSFWFVKGGTQDQVILTAPVSAATTTTLKTEEKA